MRSSFTMLIFSIAQIGCSSSYIVSSSANMQRVSFTDFNAAAENKAAKIILQNDSTLHVQGVLAQPDSMFWLQPLTRLRVAVPTQNIKKIVLKNPGLGLLEGAGIGVLAGGGGGLIVGAIWSSTFEDNLARSISFILPPLIGTGAGLLVGAISGATLGHTYEYEFLQEVGKP